jgi:hypothetical protein
MFSLSSNVPQGFHCCRWKTCREFILVTVRSLTVNPTFKTIGFIQLVGGVTVLFALLVAFKEIIGIFFFPMARQPLGGLGLVVLRRFTITLIDTPRSVGLLWTRDQLVAETST